MRNNRHIILVALCALLLVLAGCGTKKRAVASQEAEVIIEEEIVPQWHTCLIQGAQIVFTHDDDRYPGAATMQIVRDSMCIISVTAILGIEVLRIEATPDGVLGIDKLHGRYARATYDEINRLITPQLTWEIMQQICSAELPTGNETARLHYSLGKDETELVIRYPSRRLDLPLRMTSARLDKYQQIDISKLL